MKKIIVLLAVLFSANAFAASNQSINLATQVTGTLGVANGGTGQVGGLVFNSTGAASANTTAIQAALTAGGHVTIDCPAGSVVYISSTLTYYSNSIIEIPCTVRAVAGTGAMMQNYAATQSPTTLYDNSGLIASGPLSVIWSGSTPAWVVSTAYTQGKYAVANSNLYWESASSCTSAGSGSGPSGTGTGITDGTCSWNYVTTSIPNPNSGNQTVAIHWPSHGLSVGQKIFITPQPDGSTYGNYWSGTQSAHTRGGLADSAYFGVFPVLNVNDSNYITVALRRAPQVAFSGIPMNIKVADQNVTIGGGGTLDYNYTVNTGNTGAISSHAVVASGISNFKVSKAGLNIVNAQKYDLCLCSGVSDIDIGNFNTGSSGSPSDRIKVYGPAFNVNIHDSNGANGDDIVSFQTEETTSFYQYILGAGDIINGKITNVSSDGANTTGTGGNISIYPSNPNLFMDNIELTHSEINSGNLYPVYITDQSAGGSIGDLNIHDNNGRLDGSCLVSVFGTPVINSLSIQGNSPNPLLNPTAGGSATGGGSSGCIFAMNASGGEIRYLNILNNNANVYGVFVNNIAGTIDNAIVKGNVINALSNLAGFLIGDSSASGAFKNLVMDANYIIGGTEAYFVVQDKNGMNIKFVNNWLPTWAQGIINTYNADTVYFAGNYAPSNSGFGALAWSSSVTATVTSGGGNTFNKWFVANGGTVSATVYGFDIPCALGTNVTNTNGSYCQNTVASPGGTGTAMVGAVMNNTNSAGTNHWFALYSPLLQTY